MRKDAVKLLPCPFCGGKGKIKTLTEVPHEWWTVTCSNDAPRYYRQGNGCQASPMVICDTREMAVKLWNTRNGVEVKL